MASKDFDNEDQPTKIIDILVGSDEDRVLQYLKINPADFFPEIDVARRADGRHRFAEDTHWAHRALSNLLELELVETDGFGKYRVKDRENSEALKPPFAGKFLSPHLREILERSGKKFNLSD